MTIQNNKMYLFQGLQKYNEIGIFGTQIWMPSGNPGFLLSLQKGESGTWIHLIYSWLVCSCPFIGCRLSLRLFPQIFWLFYSIFFGLIQFGCFITFLWLSKSGQTRQLTTKAGKCLARFIVFKVT
jgi:hypothetical protein